MSGAARPVFATYARHHLPSAPRNVTGVAEEFVIAVGLSFPRGERPMPHTWMPALTPLSASYAAASARPQIAAAWFCPDASHCGFTNSGWLHSFITTYSRTLGNVRATSAAQAANCWMRTVLPHASGSDAGAQRAPLVSACECSG